MKALHLPIVIFGSVLVAFAQATEPRGTEDFLKLKAEAKGHLSLTVDPKNGAITSASLSCCVRSGTYPIDIYLVLGESNELQELAKKLDGQSVLVSGTFDISVSPIMNREPDPKHFSLRVETLKPAPKAK